MLTGGFCVFVNSTPSNNGLIKVSTQAQMEPVIIGVDVQRNTDGDTPSNDCYALANTREAYKIAFNSKRNLKYTKKD